MAIISIMLDTGIPETRDRNTPTTEEMVREAIEKIESGHDSREEWLLINKIYRKLCELKKPNEKAINLKKMVEPILTKYGYAGVASNGK